MATDELARDVAGITFVLEADDSGAVIEVGADADVIDADLFCAGRFWMPASGAVASGRPKRLLSSASRAAKSFAGEDRSALKAVTCTTPPLCWMASSSRSLRFRVLSTSARGAC